MGGDDIPMGYRFKPNDEEAIMYVVKKVKGEALPAIVDKTFDIYHEDELWKKEFQGTDEETTHYFFTDLKKMAANGSRFDRTVGGGLATWKSQKDTRIYSSKNNKVIGSVRSFSYKTKSRSSERWVMHEYRLHDGEKEVFAHTNNYVMCKIIKKKDPRATRITDSKIIGGSVAKEAAGNRGDDQLRFHPYNSMKQTTLPPLPSGPLAQYIPQINNNAQYGNPQFSADQQPPPPPPQMMQQPQQPQQYHQHQTEENVEGFYSEADTKEMNEFSAVQQPPLPPPQMMQQPLSFSNLSMPLGLPMNSDAIVWDSIWTGIEQQPQQPQQYHQHQTEENVEGFYSEADTREMNEISAVQQPPPPPPQMTQQPLSFSNLSMRLDLPMNSDSIVWDSIWTGIEQQPQQPQQYHQHQTQENVEGFYSEADTKEMNELYETVMAALNEE